MEKACSGFGHRTVFGNIELAVQACVIQAIEMGCTVFYTGAMGEFDRVFISAVRAAKRRYPALGLRLICVKPYLTNEMNTHKAQYDALYDDVLVPEELMGLHYKRAIPARNRWMVDRRIWHRICDTPNRWCVCGSSIRPDTGESGMPCYCQRSMKAA